MRILQALPKWILYGLTAIFLAGSLWITFRIVASGIKEPSITVAAILATVAGLFLTVARQMADRQDATSRFYLEEYRSGFDAAFEILDSIQIGSHFTRTKWIAAARVLATARKMLDRVSVQAHRQAADMMIPQQSERFQRFFLEPPAYYFGVPHPPNVTYDEATTEAAKRSTAAEGSTASTLKYVPERVIHTVWQAVKYPDSYKDVLGDKFSEGDRLFLSKGLQDYLNHRERWASAAGQLHERGPGEAVD